MRKADYQRIKAAYEMSINGCGEDCFTCNRENCVCDDEKILEDADRWIAQKEHERVFCDRNRQIRSKAAKDYYHAIKKPKRVKVGCYAVNQTSFDQLPDEFTYDDAAKIWQIEKTAAVERINKFLRLDPNCLTKTRPPRNQTILMRKVKK